MDLTDRQQQILSFIREHVREVGYPPTIREIADRVGVDMSTVKYQLDRLVDVGAIVRDPGRPRAIRIVEPA